MRGQLSIEFLIVFVGMMMILATVTYPLYDKAREDADKMATQLDAREAANTLANAVNTLYASGSGAKLVIEYWLPSGTTAVFIGGYENDNVDGVNTTDGSVSKNGRADVQIRLDLDGNGYWDNTCESVVLVDTLLPSRWDENGTARTTSWVRDNCVHVEDNNLRVGSAYSTLTRRTYHRTTLTFYDNAAQTYDRRITVSDSILESV